MDNKISDKRTFYKYKKVLRHEKHNLKDWSKKLDKIYSEEGDSELLNKSQKHIKKDNSLKTKVPFFKQVKEFEKKKAEKLKKTEEIETKNREREEALERYKKEKKRKRKIMLKVNHKGQPSMASRMDLLLEKIQNTQKS